VNDDLAIPAATQVPDGIELRHLPAFVAVADELNFSRAADRLYLSQPALSRQIRALEHLIGCDLFRGSTQRVVLTLAGESLLARARPLLAELAELAEAISATRSVGGELAARMARSYGPWLNASHDITNLEQIRAAVEQLHRPFTAPPGLTVTPVTAGGTPALRLSPPTASDGTVLFLHGGSYVAGSAFGYQHLAGAIAAAATTTTLVVDYRLAPEHPYPAGLDDAIGAYRWLLDTGAEPGTITIVGDSSGAGLAMSLLLALRDQDTPLPAAAALLCPWVDLTGRTQRPPQESPIPFLPEMARLFAHAYLAGQPADDPLVDPVHADLTGLPPLLIHAASGDSVLQEAQLLAQHAQACAVKTTITIYPVPTHDFHIFWSFLPEATAAIDQLGQFIREATKTITG
jgi:monoterpene epsilon-lactone hydrolase